MARAVGIRPRTLALMRLRGWSPLHVVQRARPGGRVASGTALRVRVRAQGIVTVRGARSPPEQLLHDSAGPDRRVRDGRRTAAPALRRQIRHRPRLLSDNGSSYIVGVLADWTYRGMTHTHGAPRHPQAGEERALAPDAEEPHPDRALLSARRSESQAAAFVERHIHARAHESLGNLMPADVCHGRGEAILAERKRIKKQALT